VLRRTLRAIFLENAALKAISLLLAVALFVFVRGDRPTEAVVDVPIVYKLPTDRVLMSTPVERLRVAVRGPWTRISRFDERDLETPLSIDLAHVTAGEFTFAADLLHVPRGIRVSAISPPSMHLEFEPRVTRTLPVEPQLHGQPASGWRVAHVSLHPDEIVVTGAQSVVEGLAAASTLPLSLAGAHGTLERTTDLEPLPRHAEYVEARPVRVEVQLTQ